MINETAKTEDFEFEALGQAHNYREAIVREFASALRGRVIEIGAGVGQMTRVLRHSPTIETLLSVEPEARFAQSFRAALPEAALLEGTIDDVPISPGWDAIFSVNVLEHIRDHEAEAVKYHRLLEPHGGHLCLLVPARPELFSDIDRDFGHFRRYTAGSLKNVLLRSGFRIEKLHYFNSVGYLAWLLHFRLRRKREFDTQQVRFYDRYIFPWVNRMEVAHCRPLIGQSLVAIAASR